MTAPAQPDDIVARDLDPSLQPALELQLPDSPLSRSSESRYSTLPSASKDWVAAS